MHKISILIFSPSLCEGTLAAGTGGPTGGRVEGAAKAADEDGELLAGRVQASRAPRGWALPGAADWGGCLQGF